MKIFCRRNELNRAVNNVSHAVPSRTTSKILEGILVELKNNKMYLTATDTNMTIEAYIEVNSEEDVSFVIPSRIFSSIISKLPEDDILLEYDDKKRKLKIKSGNSQAELICFSADEFPKIKIEESGSPIFISKETVKKLVRKTSFSASVDEMNGVLTGVLMEISESAVKMVAVDTFRMAIYSADADAGDEKNVIIPAKMINEISKIISDEEQESMVSIDIIENKAVFIFDNNRVTVNTLSGKYIDYKKIIKDDGAIEVRVIREELVKAIDRASLLSSSQNNNLIKITITDELLQINSLSDEGNIEEKVEIIKEGEDITIGFNSRYMIDALRAIDDEEIKMYLKNNVSPCIIKPLKGENYLYLILPVRIN